MAYSTIVNVKQIAVKATLHTVRQLDAVGNEFEVTSCTSGEDYQVYLYREEHYGSITVAGGRCNCTWGFYRSSKDNFRSGCSHFQAAYAYVMAEEQNRTTSAWGSLADARRQHRPMVAIGDGVILTTRKNGNGRRPVRREAMYK